MANTDIVVEARELLPLMTNDTWSFSTLPRARQVVTALADEVERLREQWNTRFNTLCGNCGKRYRGPRDEGSHGYGICNVVPVLKSED